MQIMTLDQAKTNLAQLVEAAASGEEVFITQDEVLSVQLVPCIVKKRKRAFGSAKGLISMSPDFDAPLDDFRDYSQ